MRRVAALYVILAIIIFLAMYMAYRPPAPDVQGSANITRVREKIIPVLETRLAAQGLKLGSPIYIRIFKESSELEMWVRGEHEYKLFKTYPICAHSGGLGPKLKEGDGQSPEGFYAITPAQMNLGSNYHLSFNIGFPNAYDLAQGYTGRYLMVHGNCVSAGCYAMTDAGIEEIYLLAEASLKNAPSFPVHMFPFRMSADNMAWHADPQWAGFWKDLQVGYNYFERRHIPPTVNVVDKKYFIEQAIE